MKVILLNGAPRSGKDTLANYLVDVGLADVHLKYAAGVREVAATLKPQIDWYDDEIKDVAHPELGFRTPRQFLIGIGSGLRESLGADVWVEKLIDQIKAEDYETVVISDCGFQNEVDLMVSEFGSRNVIVIHTHREGYNFKNDSRGYVDGFCSLEKLLNEDKTDFLIEGERTVRKWLGFGKLDGLYSIPYDAIAS